MLKRNEYVVVFCVFLVTVVTGVSVRASSFMSPAGLESGAIQAQSLPETVPQSVSAGSFAGSSGWSPSFILESYQDRDSRETVVIFFENLTGSREMAEKVLASADIFEIPPALAFSLCWEESRYNPWAVNSKNRNQTIDRGLFQLNSESFPHLDEADFFDIGINAWYGLSHLRWCLDTAGTDVAGIAMYNAGTTRVNTGGTPKHTLDYVSRILKRQRETEELFLAESLKKTEVLAMETAVVIEPEKPVGFRLNLLAPLGGR
jgi:hypothetical protein